MLLGDKAAPSMMGMEAMAAPMRAEKLIVQYCIEQREYNIVKINIILDDYRQPCLGE